MNRRDFLKTAALGLAGLCWPGCAGNQTPAPSVPPAWAGLKVADAHAHPQGILDRYDTTMPTLGMLNQAGVTLSVAAAVGDWPALMRSTGNPKAEAARSIKSIANWRADGRARLISRRADLENLRLPGPVAILPAIEGGDALLGQLENLDYFYNELGVRLITLLHYQSNHIGEPQTIYPSPNGLTPFGRRLVERMNRLGVVVDVAHAQHNTLKGVAEVAGRPLLDSHTHLTSDGQPQPFTRFRGWAEMELVAATGGLVCTWPLARGTRTTLAAWAAETVQIKQHLGMEHVGLGTDGGGNLDRTVQGWSSIVDWPALAQALAQAGLSNADIQAYFYGNLERVLLANLT